MRDLVARSSVRNTILMMRQVDRAKTVLLVEGDTDSRSFDRFVAKPHCRVFSPGYPGGKEHALALFDDLRQKKLPGIAALVDADCDRFWGRGRQHQNVCWTSGADRDVMILQSRAFDRFVANKNPNLDLAVLREEVLRAALPLGSIRLMSRRKNWALDFKEIDCAAFVDANTLACDEAACCREVLARNLQAQTAAVDLLEAITFVRERRPQPQDVVCGHDIAKILSVASPRRFNRIIKPEQIEAELDSLFQLNDFVQTSTFTELTEWEGRNAPFRINA
jgi:hypothetical protein